jgi:hypothetical protein
MSADMQPHNDAPLSVVGTAKPPARRSPAASAMPPRHQKGVSASAASPR